LSFHPAQRAGRMRESSSWAMSSAGCRSEEQRAAFDNTRSLSLSKGSLSKAGLSEQSRNLSCLQGLAMGGFQTRAHCSDGDRPPGSSDIRRGGSRARPSFHCARVTQSG